MAAQIKEILEKKDEKGYGQKGGPNIRTHIRKPALFQKGNIKIFSFLGKYHMEGPPS